MSYLVLSGCDGCLRLLNDDLLLTLLTLELKSLATLQLYLTWLYQLDLHTDTFSRAQQHRRRKFSDSILSTPRCNMITYV